MDNELAGRSEATMNFQFDLILKEGTEITEELADELFEAGCDNSTPGTFCGTPYISFQREAESLESAIHRRRGGRRKGRLRRRATQDQGTIRRCLRLCRPDSPRYGQASVAPAAC